MVIGATDERLNEKFAANIKLYHESKASFTWSIIRLQRFVSTVYSHDLHLRFRYKAICLCKSVQKHFKLYPATSALIVVNCLKNRFYILSAYFNHN